MDEESVEKSKTEIDQIAFKNMMQSLSKKYPRYKLAFERNSDNDKMREECSDYFENNK